MNGVDVTVPATARSMAWWGALLTAVAVSMGQLTLLFTWAYLAIEATTWPPEHAAPPPLAWAGGATLLLLVSLVPAWMVNRSARSGGLSLQGAAAVTAVLGGAAISVQLASLGALDLDVTAHAYDSITLLSLAVHHLLLAAGVVGLLMVAVRERTERRLAEIAEAMALYWSAMVALWLVVAVTIYLGPRMFGGW